MFKAAASVSDEWCAASSKITAAPCANAASSPAHAKQMQ